jgi:hypothetical protein
MTRLVCISILGISQVLSSSELAVINDLFSEEAASERSPRTVRFATPILSESARTVVLEEMLKNFAVSNQYLASVVQNRLGIPKEEAISVSSKLRKEIIRPTVQQVWFHEALRSFHGPIDFNNVFFVQHFWLFRPFGQGEEYLDENFLRQSLHVWTKYCLTALKRGSTDSCLLKSKRSMDSRNIVFEEKRWVLTPQAVEQYIGDLLWEERLSSLGP